VLTFREVAFMDKTWDDVRILKVARAPELVQ
jgi:hypothetical protein